MVTPTDGGAEAGPDGAALSLLLAWFSPSFPVGAFAYSHGIERLEADGAVRDRASTEAAVRLALTDGSGRTDAILLAHAFRAASARDEAALGRNRLPPSRLAPTAERPQHEAIPPGQRLRPPSDAVWPMPFALSGSAATMPVCDRAVASVAPSWSDKAAAPAVARHSYGPTSHQISSIGASVRAPGQIRDVKRIHDTARTECPSWRRSPARLIEAPARRNLSEAPQNRPPHDNTRVSGSPAVSGREKAKERTMARTEHGPLRVGIAARSGPARRC